MNYQELLKAWSVRIWDEAQGRVLDAYALQHEHWRWWNAQAFRLEGMAVNRKTHKAHRLTSTTERGAGWQRRVYTIGSEVVK